jgi:hypothetical protein
MNTLGAFHNIFQLFLLLSTVGNFKKALFSDSHPWQKKIQIRENRSSGLRFEMVTPIRQTDKYIQTARWHHKPIFLFKEKK